MDESLDCNVNLKMQARKPHKVLFAKNAQKHAKIKILFLKNRLNHRERGK
jgi:hypothetical protein